MKKEKQRIAISSRIVSANNYEEKRDAISHDWISIIEKIDAIPIIVPNFLSDVKSFLTKMSVEGIILSGGDNIGEDIERDNTEKELINFGIKNHIPIFGVCRGMQVLNQYFGGTMNITSNNEHVGCFHTIEIIQKKFSFFQKKTFQVNSFHNNIINERNLGDNLQPFAIINKDKTIEGFIHNEYPIIGVMWHPERDPNMENIAILNQSFNEKTFWEK